MSASFPEETVPREALADFDRATSYEWLETDGLGGWASSSVVFANTRRYHGLLVAATRPPAGRRVLLAKLDETLHAAGGDVELSANRYPGAIHPRGFEHLVSFARGAFPHWVYEAAGCRLAKTVAAIHGEPTVVVSYELERAPGPVRLELRPFFAGRPYHQLVRANGAVRREGVWTGGVFAYRPYEGLPQLFLAVPGAAWSAGPDWYFAFEYDRERERGLDFREDLFTPGSFSLQLEPGERLAVVASLADPAGRDGAALLAKEERRRRKLLAPFAEATPFVRGLALAADAFVVRRGVRGRTIVAGYPWFADWGRDAMIAVAGLCLATGRLAEAAAVLGAFARAADRGMIPNRFPDEGEEPEYNTADASLWLFVAVHRYLAAGGDEAKVAGTLLPVLRDVLAWHREGTRFGLREDADGLLHAGEAGTQLTWMDARVGGRPVTPRIGKPVEIQALWYNAWRILAELEERCGDAAAARRAEAGARRIHRAFAETFWNPERECLYDVVDGGERDGLVRPNQLFALALPFPLVTGPRARKVLARVEESLLTPVGLRSLAPGEPGYRPTYTGGPAERDAAYHQGTVWPWLLGPYLTALVRVRGDSGRRRARRILEGFAPHLGEAGIGTVSEIFDAEAPHAPRGAIAQAWSVGELLRAAVEEAGTVADEVTGGGRARRLRKPSSAAPERSPEAPRRD